MKTESASVVFQVKDIHESIDFYTRSLDFEEEFVFGNPPFYAGVKKGSVSIHLNSGAEHDDRRGKGSVYITCDEVDSYYLMIEKSKVEIVSKLETWPYEMRDFQIKDLDGNLICFGCPAGKDEKQG